MRASTIKVIRSKKSLNQRAVPAYQDQNKRNCPMSKNTSDNKLSSQC